MVNYRSEILDLDQVPFEVLHNCFAIWNRWRNGHSMPTWQEVSLHELPAGALPTCLVVDVIENPRDYVYRFWGSSLTDWHGEDLTGDPVSGLLPDLFAELTLSTYDRVCETGTPLVHADEFLTTSGAVGRQTVIRLPVSDEGRDGVEKVLSVIAMDIYDDASDKVFYTNIWAD